MSKIFSKQALPYWIIALLVVIIGIMLGSGAILNSVKVNTSGNGVTKSQAARQNTSSSTSSTTKKYVEGKDYKITYTNDGIISKQDINRALDESGLRDIDDLMDKSGGNYAKIEAYYDKDDALLIERLFENGYKSDSDVTTVGYNFKTQSMEENGGFGVNGGLYVGKPLVYKWERLVK